MNVWIGTTRQSCLRFCWQNTPQAAADASQHKVQQLPTTSTFGRFRSSGLLSMPHRSVSLSTAHYLYFWEVQVKWSTEHASQISVTLTPSPQRQGGVDQTAAKTTQCIFLPQTTMKYNILQRESRFNSFFLNNA